MDGTTGQPRYSELAALVARLQVVLAALRAENQQLNRRIAELETKNPPPRLDESYSLKAGEKRRQEEKAKDSGKAMRHGSSGYQQASERRWRIPNQEKIDLADHHELVLPDGFDLPQCHPGIERPVWRIRDGIATLIVYEIWRGRGGEEGEIDGVLPLSEFGFEIQVTVAFMVSMVALSMDEVCTLLRFFWQLELSKSQADALLSQLSRQWEHEFESLCRLLALNAVVHAGETSWSLNSVWAFLSEKARVLVFGCRKDGDTLARLITEDGFAGILVSDDAAVYQGFTNAQKCRAHLIRKAIRFTLVQPDNSEYQGFLDRLLAIFVKAKRTAAELRLKAAGRAARVAALFDDVCELCFDRSDDESCEPPSGDETDREFYNLVHEVARLSCDQQIFTFVLHPEVGATNNEAERSLRGATQDRRTGRTSKTLRGAQRRTILMSVLESLKLHLAKFTLDCVLTEVQSWWHRGESLFDRLAKECGLDPLTDSRLDKLVPLPKPGWKLSRCGVLFRNGRLRHNDG